MQMRYTTEMVEMTATVRNDRGIHCRPAGIIFKAIEDYDGKIVLITGETEITLTTIMDIIILGLFKGDSVIIRVSGKDEDTMCKKLIELFEKKYDFPPRKKC